MQLHKKCGIPRELARKDLWMSVIDTYYYINFNNKKHLLKYIILLEGLSLKSLLVRNVYYLKNKQDININWLSNNFENV